MPKVVITFDPEHHEYWVQEVPKTFTHDPEYQVVMDMKASHFRNIMRNAERYERDLDTLRKFFIEAQMAGRAIRER